MKKTELLHSGYLDVEHGEEPGGSPSAPLCVLSAAVATERGSLFNAGSLQMGAIKRKANALVYEY